MPGWPETIFIFIVALLIFGPKKLPELARGLAKGLNEIKKVRDEFEHELRKTTAEVEIKTSADTQPHQPTSQSSPVPSESGVPKRTEAEKPA